jgi:FAD/FMN-containing dehydrogenase
LKCEDQAVNRRVFLERAVVAPLAGVLAGCASKGSASSPVRPRRVSLGDLRAALRGPVLVPGDSGYAAARRVYNERYVAIRPRAVAVAASEEDVRACVEWAGRSGVGLVARSGGHSYAGYSTTRGVVCDLRGLDAISVAADGRSVTAGAGCRLIDVVSALARRGLAVPSGSCPTVGLGGLALGGGVGLASRALGTTSDNVVSLRVVTADGRALEAGPDAHSDLYWACRGGGGGNFGIATAITLRTHPVGDVAYVFCDWPWSQASASVDAWQALAPHAPDALYLLCSLATDPSGPRVRVFGQLLGGTERELRALIAPLAAVPGATISTGSASYLDAQRIWAGCAGETDAACRAFRPARFGARSDYANRAFPLAAITTAIRFIEQRQSHGGGTGAFLLDPYGGALNRVAADATAFVHRDQLFSCQYLAYSQALADVPAADAWLAAFHAAMRPSVSGQAYQNYIDPTLEGWEQAYYASNLPRLRAIKRSYDPHNLFRFPQSISG